MLPRPRDGGAGAGLAMTNLDFFNTLIEVLWELNIREIRALLVD
jgi:hypothetical protein